MLRRKLEHGQIVEEKTIFNRGEEARGGSDHSDLSEDYEARPISKRKKSKKRARFDDEQEDDL